MLGIGGRKEVNSKIYYKYKKTLTVKWQVWHVSLATCIVNLGNQFFP